MFSRIQNAILILDINRTGRKVIGEGRSGQTLDINYSVLTSVQRTESVTPKWFVQLMPKTHLWRTTKQFSVVIYIRFCVCAIYIFQIRKLQSCRVPGGPAAVTSELHCGQSSTSLLGVGGLTAVTTKYNTVDKVQLHFRGDTYTLSRTLRSLYP